MDALSNHPPLAERLDLQYDDLRSDIARALEGFDLPTVATDEDALQAAEIVKPLRAMQARIEKEFKAEKLYYLEGGRTVDSFFKTIRVELDATVAAIAKAVNDFQEVKRAKQRAADAEARKAAVLFEEPAPAAVAPKETVRVASAATGVVVSGTVRWLFEVTDASQLPRDLLMPNEAAIKARVAGLKATVSNIDDAKIEGVRIFEKVGSVFR